MGILTNPDGMPQKTKYVAFLIKYNSVLCNFLFICGLVWFSCLSDLSLNHGTYFSENALLPGLVYSEVKRDSINQAKLWIEELKRERETYSRGVPYPWLLAKMRQIGLETHTQNFTLRYPFGGGKTFTGKNVYGILRAPRIGSTEAIVISCPYRYPESIHTDISHGVALMLAFADFARRQKYWAKDIIFLITDQEQLGMQAWLDAYYGRSSSSALESGSLEARAGAIQAAINLEIHSFDIDYINVKLEGLNGQLPNLDLVNLVQKLSNKEGISCGYKMTSTRRHLASQSRWKNIEKMLMMVLTQSSGVPTGNHGLFHRFGVEAVTLEAVHRQQTQNAAISLSSLLKIVEGISRSLNNLLEKFHQSFFFYLMVANDRFVSIGDYMPSVGLMAGALMIKAFILWLELNQEDEDKTKEKVKQRFDLIRVGIIFIAAHALGFLAINAPFFSLFNILVNSLSLTTETVLFFQFAIISAVGFLIANFLTLKSNFDTEIMQIVALLELGTILLVVSMLNFSLGFLLSAITVPLAGNLCCFKAKLRPIKKLLLLLMHPICICFVVVTLLTTVQYPELAALELATRSFTATKNAFVFSVVDSVIYGNWMFTLICLVFLPLWILFWNVISNYQTIDAKLKQN